MLDIRFLHSLIPIFADKEPNGKEITSVSMCQNQAAHFQMAFKINDKSAQSVGFYIKLDTKLPISMYYINNVPVLHTSSLNNGASIGMYPDVLLEKSINPRVENHPFPWQNFMAEQGEDVFLRAFDDSWQAVWFCVNEHEKTVKSGTYTINLSLFDSQGNPLNTATFQVEVLPLKLPKQKLMYTNWFHHDCLADTYGHEVFSERHFEIIPDWIEKAARNGMNMIYLPAFTPPLDTGIHCERTTMQLLDITKNKDKYTFDFTRMKRYIDLCKKCGITYFEHAHFFTQWGAKGAPKIIVTENGKSKKLFGWKAKASGKPYVNFLRQYITSLKEFLKQEKLEKKILFHISDEPNQDMVEGYTLARNAIIDLLDGYMVGDAMSNVLYYEKGLCKTPIADISHIHDFIGKCDDLWVYYTGGSSLGKSSRLLTMPREANRMMGVLLYYYNIKGFLHWGYNSCYGEQSQYKFNALLNPNGGYALPATSFIVYPALDGSCTQSVRQKTFFEGLTDIRLLTLLEKVKGKDTVNKLIEKYFGVPHFDKTPSNPETYIRFLDELYNNMKGCCVTDGIM